MEYLASTINETAPEAPLQDSVEIWTPELDLQAHDWFHSTPFDRSHTDAYIARRNEQMTHIRHGYNEAVAAFVHHTLEVDDGKRHAETDTHYSYLRLRQRGVLSTEDCEHIDDQLDGGDISLEDARNLALLKILGADLAGRLLRSEEDITDRLEIHRRTESRGSEIARFTTAFGHGRQHKPVLHRRVRDAIQERDPNAQLHTPKLEKLVLWSAAFDEHGRPEALSFSARFGHGTYDGGTAIRARELFIVPIGKDSPLARSAHPAYPELARVLRSIVGSRDRNWRDRVLDEYGLLEHIIVRNFEHEYADRVNPALPDEGWLMQLSTNFCVVDTARIELDKQEGAIRHILDFAGLETNPEGCRGAREAQETSA